MNHASRNRSAAFLRWPNNAACPAMGGHAKNGAPRHGNEDAVVKFVRKASSTAKVAFKSAIEIRSGNPCT